MDTYQVAVKKLFVTKFSIYNDGRPQFHQQRSWSIYVQTTLNYPLIALS